MTYGQLSKNKLVNYFRRAQSHSHESYPVIKPLVKATAIGAAVGLSLVSAAM